MTSLPDQLDEAATYIKKLQISLEKMKEKKNSLMGIDRTIDNNVNASGFRNGGGAIMSLKSPQIEIHEMGSALEIVLITGLDCQFMFNETIRVLHEEGADIVNASFSVVEDTVFHTMHCKVMSEKTIYKTPFFVISILKFSRNLVYIIKFVYWCNVHVEIDNFVIVLRALHVDWRSICPGSWCFKDISETKEVC